ncbi:MAG: CTP synthase [Candidatus Colwellbacteria bacterium]|nr:CTP synthase [Candidatus Colwellbacteria bacterium]
MTKNLKYIFVVGGVMSGVGKGVAAAAIGKILQARGLNVTAVKIDPYVNVDAGTMNPTEHGEVFVLDDGMECDQDMGNYERFLGVNLTGRNYMTTGSIYLSVINRERSLGYGGKCVEVVPHIPLEVIDRINKAATKDKANAVIVEIGGTVGEYQNILFLEAIRMLKTKKPQDVVLVLVSYLPIRGKDNELKTKPTQYAVRTLNSAGLQPDIVIARAEVPLDKKRKQKIAYNCGLEEKDIISAPDVTSIYDIPITFEKEKIGDQLFNKLNLRPKKKDLHDFKNLARTVRSLKKPVSIGIVGKYFGTGDFILADSYISVLEAIKHAAYALKRKPVIEWVDSEELGNLDRYDGIIIPGGFGSRGIEGKLTAINFARRKKIPFFGLCYGMQLAIVEFSRSVARLKGADSTEIDAKTPHPVIDILPEQKKNLSESNYGATMRLGAWPAVLEDKTIARTAYGKEVISERHRHRYEVNPEYIQILEAKGLIFSGISPNRRLMEIMELPKKEHPFFVGTQFHPEFKSRPLTPHPLFKAFIKASIGSRK